MLHGYHASYTIIETKQQFRDRHFPEAAIKSVLDVFSVQQDEVFAEGLVNCNSDNDFSDELQVLEKRWSKY